MEALMARRLRESLDESSPHPHVLLRRTRATLPVLLSAPHGGGDKHYFPTPSLTHSLARMKPRIPGGKGVSLKADLHTLPLLASLDKHIHDMCGHHCYLVAATLHRKFVDTNRDISVEEDNAHHPECELSKEYYDAYHSSVKSCLEDIRLRHPHTSHVLLLDIHGQATYEDMVVLDMPLQGFIWHLQSLLGQASLPHPGREDISPYKGGHIVGKYGSQSCDLDHRREMDETHVLQGLQGLQVSAVQLEFGSALRSDSVLRSDVAKSTATAVIRSLWPASCLSVAPRIHPEITSPIVAAACKCRCDCANSWLCSSNSNDLCKCDHFIDINDVCCEVLAGDDTKFLVSTPPTMQCEPLQSKLEHSYLLSLKRQGDDFSYFPSHPWLHGQKVESSPMKPSIAYGCGERGRTLIRRHFIPQVRTVGEVDRSSLDIINVEEKNDSDYTMGYINGLIYTSDDGYEMEKCDDMNTANPDYFIWGRLVTYSSDGEICMMLLEHQDSVSSSQQCHPVDLTSSEKEAPIQSSCISSIKCERSWHVVQVVVGKPNSKIRHYLAMSYANLR